MSKSTPQSILKSRLFIVTASISVLTLISVAVVLAAISLSTSSAYTQNFDAIGTSATAALPTDWRVDKPSTVRTVGTFAAATATTNLAGGANLSSSAANGIYNFGSGTTTTGPDRAVGFLSSGTATSSGNLYAQLVNSTGGNLSGVQISYDVEKYRNGSNPSGFRIQVFYSLDGTTWTSAGSDFLTSFAADANNNGFTTAPGATVSVTNKTVSVSVPNGGNLYLAWNYSVAATSTTTNAQALAIDNVSILGIAGGGPTNPTGVGNASPSSVDRGATTLLTVTVTPGTSPASTAHTVSADLTSIGGLANQAFHDDGLNGDALAADNIFSFSATVSNGAAPGGKSLPVTITETAPLARTGSTTISMTVNTPTNPTGVGAANPSTVAAGGTSLLTVSVSPGTHPVSTGISVTGNLTSIGGSASQVFADNGLNGDAAAGDNIFSYNATVSAGTSAGIKTISTTIADAQGRTGSANISLTVTSATTNPSGTGAANPSSVAAGNATLLTVTVTPGAGPTSTGLGVTANLSSIGGSISQVFADDGLNGDATAGDNVFSYNATVGVATTTGAKSLPFSITDAQGRSGSGNISLTVSAQVVAQGTVVISQVYGGGGNSGATYTNDFVEIFNRGNTTVSLAGWSVQYTSSSGTGSWSRTPLTGTVAPGQYYLVQEGAGTGGTTPLPTPNATGTIAMAATSGHIALVTNNTTLPSGCPNALPQLMDLVGYGAAACFEGAGAAPLLDNVTADFRSHLGCKDTDSNGGNFFTGPPNPRNTSTAATVCPVGDFEPEIFATTPSANDTHIPVDSNIIINFDEPVDVIGNWFQISCTSGLHTATVSGGPTSFTLNPDSDFVFNEPCTVTVFAAQVSDQDLIDPPDHLAADYVFTFNSEFQRDPAEHMVMGNPSNATTNVGDTTNFLMMKTQYAFSYNDSRGAPNWTSWHLDSTWRGSAPRQDDFRNDTTLPPGYHQVLGTDFTGSGFDRGHMCPSADRTSTIPDNSATFLMDNMIAQSPDNNQGPWAAYENYLRTFLPGSEIYIISGSTGTGGAGSNGASNGIVTPSGFVVNVPAVTWKVALILPVGDNDISRVDGNTRTIAVIMPNTQGIRSDQWQKYLATVDQVEALSGYDFYSNVPTSIQDQFEAKLDAGNDTAPVANNGSATTGEDTSKTITLTASDFNVNNVLTFTIASEPAHGALGFVSTPFCSNGNCTATVTYTPAAAYDGPDSFTFTVNDGALDSANAGTVNISVTPKAAQTITFAPLSDKTYGDAPFMVAASGGGSGNPVTFGASGNCTSSGVNGSTITITGAGSCNVTASQAGDATYKAAPNVSQGFTINQATATISVSGYTGAYDGNAHGATGSATGVNGEDLTSLLNLGGTFTNVPGGAAHWTFAGNANYAPSSGDVAITINKASSTTTVTCSASETYTGSAIEPCTATATGAGGLNQSVPVLYTNNINAGSASATATYGGDANHDGSTGNGSFTINKASSTTTVNCPASATYNGSAIEPCTATATGVGGLNQSVAVLYTNNVNAGSASATATYGGDANHDSSTGNGSFTITKASSTTTVNCPTSETYTGSAIEPCTATVTGAGGLNQSVTVLYTNNVNAGSASASATYAGDANHEGSSGNGSFTITKASSTTTVNCPASATYTGAAIEPCNATVTGAGGLNQSVAVLYANNTNAGSASATATYSGDVNHDGSSGNGSFTITKAASTTTVNCPASETYTGSAIEPCTASYSGAGGLSGSLTPSYANNTDAGTASATATYGGDANHEGSSGNGSFTITQASSTTTVTCTGSPVYTGSPITPCSVAVTGANLSLTPAPVYANNANAGTNTASASYTFAGDANHTGSSDSKNFSIAKANATVSVSGYTGVYDGNSHGASGTAMGVNGEDLSSLLNLGASFTNVPGGTAHWTFNAGNTNGNYNSTAGDVSITITKATPSITWNNPADIVYGTALSSTQLNATASVAGSFNYTPASGTVLNTGSAQSLLANFTPTDATNYNATSKNVQINVLKATPSFSNLSSPAIAYGTPSTNLSGKITFGSLIPTGSVAITLNGVTQNAAIQSGGNFSSSFATGSLAAGSYNITYSYAGDSNFNSASGSGTLTVGYGVVPLYDQTNVHQSGSTIPIKLKIVDANGNNISSANLVVNAVGVSLISTSVYGPVEDAGNANPDNDFRFSQDSYIFNLKTTGLTTGVYNLYFRVGADPTLHTVQFQIK